MGSLTLARSPLLLDYDPRVLLHDPFGGGNLDLSKWTPTDTENKITVSGGLLRFAGGKATPAWNDPALVSNQFWTRVRGLTLDWQATPALTTTYSVLGFAANSTLAADVRAEPHGIQLNQGVLKIHRAVIGELATPFTYTAGQSLWLRIVCLATGAYYYVSSDNRATWKLLWVDSIVTTTPLYLHIQSYDAALTADQCTLLCLSVQPAVISLTPAAVTVEVGADVVVNGGFAADTDWVKGAGWTISAGEAHAAITGTSTLSQPGILTIGQWYRYAFTVSDYVAGDIRGLYGGTEAGRSISANGAYLETGRCATDTSFYLQGINDFVGDVDDVSCGPLTLSTLLGANQTARKEGIFERAVTVAVGYQAGFWLNWDGLTDGTEDYVEAIVDRAAGTARLSKCVNGTITNNLVSGAITYGAGKVLRVIRVGTSYQLYYDGTTVGTSQSITDNSIKDNTGFTDFQTEDGATGDIVCHGGIGIA